MQVIQQVAKQRKHLEQLNNAAQIVFAFLDNTEVLFIITEYLTVFDILKLLRVCRQIYQLKKNPYLQLRILKFQLALKRRKIAGEIPATVSNTNQLRYMIPTINYINVQKIVFKHPYLQKYKNKRIEQPNQLSSRSNKVDRTSPRRIIKNQQSLQQFRKKTEEAMARQKQIIYNQYNYNPILQPPRQKIFVTLSQDSVITFEKVQRFKQIKNYIHQKNRNITTYFKNAFRIMRS